MEADAVDKLSGEILDCTYSLDLEHLATGSAVAFAVFTVTPLSRVVHNFSLGGFSHATLLRGAEESDFQNCLIALVGSGDQPGSSPRKLKIWSCQSKETICELTFRSSVRSLLVNEIYMSVSIETHIHIFELSTMTEVKVMGVPKNGKGMMAMSRHSAHTHDGAAKTLIAYPNGESSGVVTVSDVLDEKTSIEIHAHRSAIAALVFNNGGTLLSTASSTGTIIRVFDTATGDRLFCFRRGLTEAAILSVCFCQLDAYLAVGSSTGSVHIFALSSEDHVNEGSILATTASTSAEITGNATDATDSSGAVVTASRKLSDSSLDSSFVKISIPPDGAGRDASGGYQNNEYDPKIVLHNMTQRTISALSNLASASGLSNLLNGKNSSSNKSGQLNMCGPLVGSAVSQLGRLGNKAQRDIVEEQLALQRARYMATVPGIGNKYQQEQGQGHDQGKEFTLCVKYCERTDSNPAGDLKLLVVTKMGYFYRFAVPGHITSPTNHAGRRDTAVNPNRTGENQSSSSVTNERTHDSSDEQTTTATATATTSMTATNSNTVAGPVTSSNYVGPIHCVLEDEKYMWS